MKKNKNGVRPLSPVLYFINNKRKSFSMVIALAVSILLIMVFQIVFYAVNESGHLAYSGRLDNMTVIYPGEEGGLKEEFLSRIRKNPNLERTVPIQVMTTDYYHFFGNLNIPVYMVSDDNLKFVIDKLKLKLKEGKLPSFGKAEILLDERTARNKGKSLGDYIGKEVDSDERMSGKYKIVGILKGECLIGLGIQASNLLNEKNGLLVFPKEGKLTALNEIFKGINQDEAKIQTKEYGQNVFKEDIEMSNMVTNIMVTVVIFITSFAAGNLNYTQYFSRRYEFGTLQAIGYSRFQILLRAAVEILILNITGFIFGIILVFMAAALLKVIVFDPKGYPFVYIQLEGFIKAIIIPACTIVFSLIPAWWTLSRVNPMEVVELYE